MKSMKKSTEVILVGTVHLAGSEYLEYANRLTQIVEEIAPDLICAEVSRE